MPQKRGLIDSGSAADSVVIDRPEVLDARIVRGATWGAIFVYRSSFQSMRLGDRLDHQVAFAEQRQVLLVVGRLDQRRVLGHAQRCRLELLQVLDRLQRDAGLRAVLGGQVEQHDRHLHVDEVGGDLRAHHAGAEHGDLADLESTHFGVLQ